MGKQATGTHEPLNGTPHPPLILNFTPEHEATHPRWRRRGARSAAGAPAPPAPPVCPGSAWPSQSACTCWAARRPRASAACRPRAPAACRRGRLLRGHRPACVCSPGQRCKGTGVLRKGLDLSSKGRAARVSLHAVRVHRRAKLSLPPPEFLWVPQDSSHNPFEKDDFCSLSLQSLVVSLRPAVAVLHYPHERRYRLVLQTHSSNASPY